MDADDKKYPEAIKNIGQVDPSIYVQYDRLIMKYMSLLDLMTRLNKDVDFLIDNAHTLALRVADENVPVFVRHYAALKQMKMQIQETAEGINQ